MVQGIMIQEWTCGEEVMLIMQYNQLYIHRAVGCIFGELLNNSPLFPVSYKFKLYGNYKSCVCMWFVAL